MTEEHARALITGENILAKKDLEMLHNLGRCKGITAPSLDKDHPHKLLAAVIPFKNDTTQVVILPTHPKVTVLVVEEYVPSPGVTYDYKSAFTMRFVGAKDWFINNAEYTPEKLSEEMIQSPVGFGCKIRLRSDVLGDQEALQAVLEDALIHAEEMSMKRSQGEGKIQDTLHDTIRRMTKRSETPPEPILDDGLDKGSEDIEFS